MKKEMGKKGAEGGVCLCLCLCLCVCAVVVVVVVVVVGVERTTKSAHQPVSPAQPSPASLS